MARKKAARKKKNNGANLGFEAKLWLAADKLRANMDAAEYKHVVLGLIFLKYISDAFDEMHAKLVAGEGDYEGADPEDADEYRAENVFWVPKDARWQHLQDNAKQPSIGKTVDDAMVAIERDNPRLKGVLPKDFARPACCWRWGDGQTKKAKALLLLSPFLVVVCGRYVVRLSIYRAWCDLQAEKCWGQDSYGHGFAIHRVDAPSTNCTTARRSSGDRPAHRSITNASCASCAAHFAAPDSKTPVFPEENVVSSTPLGGTFSSGTASHEAANNGNPRGLRGVAVLSASRCELLRLIALLCQPTRV